MVDRASGRELVNSDAALGFNHYVYDRYATVGQSNHNSSKFADIGNLALISSRDVGGPAAVVEATEDARGQQVVLEQRVAGADWLRVTYRLPRDLAHLEITNRLSKSSTWDKESAYFAFPFAVAEPEVLQESAGGLTGSGQESVPGGAEYMRAIRHFVSLGDGDQAIGWATAEAPARRDRDDRPAVRAVPVDAAGDRAGHGVLVGAQQHLGHELPGGAGVRDDLPLPGGGGHRARSQPGGPDGVLAGATAAAGAVGDRGRAAADRPLPARACPTTESG